MTKTKNKSKKKANPSKKCKDALPFERPQVHLSQCALSYMRALTDPHSLGPHDKLPCIPDGRYVIPSRKIRLITRLTMTVGTNGWGYLLINPRNVTSAPVAGSDAQCVYTEAAFNGNFIAQDGPGVAHRGVTNDFDSKLNANTNYRVVACGAKVTNTSPSLTTKGTVYSLRHPDNVGLTGTLIETLPSYPSCKIKPSRSGRSYYVNFLPTTNGDYDYRSTPVSNSPPMVIAVAGGLPGDTYYCEVVTFVELIGLSAMGKTPSEADPVAFGEILQQVSSNSITNNDLSYTRMVTNVAEGIASGTSWVYNNRASLAAAYNGIRGIYRANNHARLTNDRIRIDVIE